MTPFKLSSGMPPALLVFETGEIAIKPISLRKAERKERRRYLKGG